VDSKGGIGLSGPPEYINVPSTQERQVISVPETDFRDGDTVVVWFTVSDIAGNKDDVQLTVGLDRTPPRISTDNFQKKTVDEFTSRYRAFAVLKLLTVNEFISSLYVRHQSVSLGVTLKLLCLSCRTLTQK